MSCAQKKRLFIGLMSGTSVDAVDAVLVSFIDDALTLEAHHSITFPEALRERILSLFNPGHNEIDLLGELDIEIALIYADCVNDLLKQNTLHASDIEALGSHGQTIRHRPQGAQLGHPFTLQIGDPNTLACRTGITTLADFRRKDIAHGGQGAPLAPAFHADLCRNTLCINAEETLAVVNIGGIANVSLVNLHSLSGFDTGPGNGLMDAWINRVKGLNYDHDGQWAATGQVHVELLNSMLNDPFFRASPPKSTGKEYFNLTWLDAHLNNVAHIEPATEDVQATLCELTANSIIQAIHQSHPGSKLKRVFVCGGGAMNTQLMSRLQAQLKPSTLSTSGVLGIAPNCVEAAAFAWLAKQTLDKRPGSRASVTGANNDAILGGIYLP